MRIIRKATLINGFVISVLIGICGAVVVESVMPGRAWFGLIPSIVIIALLIRRPFRRLIASQSPFPDASRDWLRSHVPFYAGLSSASRARFERDVQLFMSDQTFEAVDGAELTELLKLSVSAGAALMLHGRPDWAFSNLRTFLFYPDRFDEDYYNTRDAAFDGMAHSHGPIIFSVRAVKDGWAHSADGNNVVLHELAHLFDFDQAAVEGAPSLMDPGSVDAWMELVRREMRLVRRDQSMLRPYAATNPAEFFAVSVENFFERPRAMAIRHSELFQALVAFFNLDPTPREEA